MAGFTNDSNNYNIMYTDNLDFSGSATPSATVTTDGQLLIGASSGQRIRVNTLTAGPGISIINGPGTIMISSSGGSTNVDSFAMQSGTSPVVPDTTGLVTFSGGTAAAGTNPVITVGGTNTMTLTVQRSQAIAATDATKVGLSNFDSAAFTVDANGFVQLVGGGTPSVSFDVQANTAPGTDPVVPTGLGVVTINGAAVANHSVPLETRSRAANAYNLEIQYAASAAATDATKSGIAHFDSAKFTVDANGFVSTSGTGIAQTITGDNAVALSPTGGNWNILGTANQVATSGAGSTLTLSTPATFVAPGSIKSTTTVEVGSGNLTVDSGNIVLPSANAGLTQGLVSWTGSGLRIHDYGSDNIFIGAGSGSGTLTGIDSVGIGANTLSAATYSGIGNFAIGANTLRNVTSGSNNVGVGVANLNQITTQSANTAIGTNALNAATSAASTGIGYQALAQVTSGNQNTAIGYQAGYAYTSTESNNISIGYNVTGTLGESGVTRIGSAQTACYIDGIDGVNVGSVATVVTESGDKLGTATITGGAGITITPSANAIQISTSGGGFTWTDVTGTTQTLAVSNGYVSDNAGTVTFTLPASASLGDCIKIVGKLGAWTIAQNANQQICVGNTNSTVGVGGSVSSTNLGDCITLRCITAGASTVWRAESTMGNLTIV